MNICILYVYVYVDMFKYLSAARITDACVTRPHFKVMRVLLDFIRTRTDTSGLAPALQAQLKEAVTGALIRTV